MMKFLQSMSLLFLLAGCSTTFTNQNPRDRSFPSVTGKTLAGVKTQLPEDLKGKPSILLLGFVQDSQFDIDRWLIGLDQNKVQTNVYEVPTINSFWANLFQERIDEGMRSGIPDELWSIVIAVYEDGETIQKFTGNETPRNARVILLDPQGKVIFFHDQGFSVGALNQLKEALSI